MRTVGLFEAKQKLSEIVGRASAGEKIGITRRGKLAALVVPAQPEVDLAHIFKNMEQVRRRVRRDKRINIREMIEEGRS